MKPDTPADRAPEDSPRERYEAPRVESIQLSEEAAEALT